jgi:uncharacterized protein
MKRIYEFVIEEHLEENRQMLFLVGPRQVGKTTTSLDVSETRPVHHYMSWDNQADRLLILEGPDAVADTLRLKTLRQELPIIVFDELHKYSQWKTFLKGFFDKYSHEIRIIVTGSARLDVYRVGGDSLMGRYFLYRLHPLSVGELLNPNLRTAEITTVPQKINDKEFNDLFEFGGFPEPFLKGTQQFYNRWKRLRLQQLFKEDLRDLTKIQEIGQLQVLAELLRHQSGQLTSYTALSKKVNVSIDTIKRWIETLKSFYYCFSIRPWTKNVTRSLLKEPKIYLWDWSLVEDEGSKIENFIASHLLKAVNFWTDRGLGEYELYFLRDKEQREVDFLVSKNGTPWFIVEVKKSDNQGISKPLYYYQEMLNVKHAFQVSFDMDYVDRDCFSYSEPIIVPAKTFLSQLV